MKWIQYTVDTTKDVTFYYDPESGIYYSNASDKEVATNKLVFDSKDTAYKSVYGAVATGEEVTYPSIPEMMLLQSNWL